MLTTLPIPVEPAAMSISGTSPSETGKSMLTTVEPWACVMLRLVLTPNWGLACKAAAIFAAASAGVFSALVISTLTPATVIVPGMGVPEKVIA